MDYSELDTVTIAKRQMLSMRSRGVRSPAREWVLTRRFLASLMCLICLSVSSVVLIGWSNNIKILTTICVGCASMQYATAAAFLCQSLTTAVIVNNVRSDRSQGLVIGMMMSTAVLISFGLAGLMPLAQSSIVPSWGTFFSFLSLIVIDLSYAVKFHWKPIAKVAAMTTTVLGACGIVGYALNIPQLYFHFPGACSGMAVHTACLFSTLGIAHLVAHPIVKSDLVLTGVNAVLVATLAIAALSI
jgi:hypothetical protein